MAGQRRRIHAWHLAAAGVAAEALYAAYAVAASPPRAALDLVTHGLVAFLLLAVGLLGVVPAILLRRPAGSPAHRAGRRVALGLGMAFTLSLFWSPEGVFLLAAGGWAFWRERPAPSTP